MSSGRAFHHEHAPLSHLPTFALPTPPPARPGPSSFALQPGPIDHSHLGMAPDGPPLGNLSNETAGTSLKGWGGGYLH